MNKIVLGIVAHVDAGKTTLAESILYKTGGIRKLGRVDNRDAYLDTNEMERDRGITIFAKQAEVQLAGKAATLLDTPGHVDFAAEMERTLQVLDYAILVISGADGVQGHTVTLWKLLKQYRVPTFLFINKMDQNGTDKEQLQGELQEKLSEDCIDFSAEMSPEFLEEIAMHDEQMLEHYLETGTVERENIAALIAERRIFPCFFGSALKLDGIEEFLNGLDVYTQMKRYPTEFGARVFKIARDEQGSRLTYMKITGGSLKPKALIVKADEWQEKINQIRIYSGEKYELCDEVKAGIVCAVTGLSQTYPGEGLGVEAAGELPILEPVLTYEIKLPPDTSAPVMLPKLKLLEEEEPQLHIVWNEKLQEIQAQLMGEVQIEILKRLIWDRFHVEVEFGPGNIVYKETIAAPVEGVGHFEPLRHYAEVHLLLEPGEPKTGMQFFTDCSEDVLAKNWQRLILTHLEEREHIGVLTGSVVTDMHITLIAGRAHPKHTEGGDFRQATYRAVRQGLKKAESVLLEPFYDFTMEVPADVVGHAMMDIEKLGGKFEAPETMGDMTIIKGFGPVSTLRDYQRELVTYTRGLGRLNCTLRGYEPCHNAGEVIAAIGYDSERDQEHPTSSVFCAHGAGYIVEWDEVEEHQHMDTSGRFKERDIELTQTVKNLNQGKSKTIEDSYVAEKELQEIFARTFGAPKRDLPSMHKIVRSSNPSDPKYEQRRAPKKQLEEYLLVDGYNIMFAWEELNELSKISMDGARGRLMDILCNYQGYKKCNLILVFDAYKEEGFPGETEEYHNIHVVYTKEAETADQYIEKFAHDMGRTYHVTVATSDGLEQVIIRGQGCDLLSARDLKKEIELMQEHLQGNYLDQHKRSHNYLFDYLSDEEAEQLEKIRLGKLDDENKNS